MQVQVVEDAAGTWLRVRGPVDFAEAQALVRAGLALLRGDTGSPLRLDLAGVSYLDSSGLSALLDLQLQAAHLGRKLEVHNPSAPVLQILRLTRLEQAFSLQPEGSSEGALRNS